MLHLLYLTRQSEHSQQKISWIPAHLVHHQEFSAVCGFLLIVDYTLKTKGVSFMSARPLLARSQGMTISCPAER